METGGTRSRGTEKSEIERLKTDVFIHYNDLKFSKSGMEPENYVKICLGILPPVTLWGSFG
jgi:hypothetical protein